MTRTTETFEAAHLYEDRFVVMVGTNTVTLGKDEMEDLIDLLIETPRGTAAFGSHVDVEYTQFGDDRDAALLAMFLGPHVTLPHRDEVSPEAGYAVVVAIECGGRTETVTVPRLTAWQVLHDAVEAWLALRNP